MVAIDRALGARNKTSAGPAVVGPAETDDRRAAESGSQIVSRAYTLAITASAIPLIAIIVLLAVFQFTSQRAQLLEELEDDVIEHNVLLTGVVKNVRDYVMALATWAEIHVERAVPDGDGPAWEASEMRFLVRPETETVDTSLPASLAPHMRLSHEAMPYLRWSYYVSDSEDFAALFPVPDGQYSGGSRGRTDDGAALDLVLAHTGAKGDASAADAGRSSGWSEAHVDPGGAGWVVTHGSPVRHRKRMVGVVGTSILLDFLTGFVRAFDHPCGRLWLVNESRQLLATSEVGPILDPSPPGLADVTRQVGDQVALGDLLAPSVGFRRLGDSFVFTQQVGTAPWRLVFVVDPSELNRVILPRFISYGIILAGLVLTLVLSHLLRASD